MKKFIAYTYMEILIVLSIIGSFSMLAAVNFYDLKQQQTMMLLKQKVVTVLEQAQAEADIQEQSISLCFADFNNHCVMHEMSQILLFKIKNNHKAIVNKIKLPKVDGFFQWRLFPKYSSYLTFTYGQINKNTNGTLWFCQQQYNPMFAIVINKTGRVRLLKSNASGQFYDEKHKLLKCN